jgi:hypothetical protein
MQQLTIEPWSIVESLDFCTSWGWDVLSALMTTRTMEMRSDCSQRWTVNICWQQILYEQVLPLRNFNSSDTRMRRKSSENRALDLTKIGARKREKLFYKIPCFNP